MYAVGYYSVQTIREEKIQEIDNFAESLETEVDILNEVQGGYVREIQIPPHLVSRFNPSLNQNLLILENPSPGKGEPETLSYFLSGDANIAIISEDRDGDLENETYFILRKDFVDDFEGIELN